jgi:imidazolonepropionase-like amidohydrolase
MRSTLYRGRIMKRSIPILLGLLILLPEVAWAQTVPTVGLRDNPVRAHALTGARVIVSPGNVIENATVVVRDGVIEAVGANVTPPADARVWDAAGLTVYPGFIDAHSDVGMGNPRTNDTNRGPAYWNSQVQAFMDAGLEYSHSADDASEMREQGFGAVMSVPQLGIFRGQTAVVSLGAGPNARRVLTPGIAQSVSFSRSNALGGGYPNSGMGIYSLMRQTLLDTDWYERARAAYEANPAGLERPERNRALEALQPVARGEQPVLFDTSNEDQLQWALELTNEFSLTPWFRGSGNEYRILHAMNGFNHPLILPVNFPNRPNLGANPEGSIGTSLSQLRNWYFAPENPGRLAAAGIDFVLTTDGLNDKSNFFPNIRRAVERGLDADVALRALTTGPAQLLGVTQTHGTIEVGKVANLVVTEGDLFREDTSIRDVWVDGNRYEVSRPSTLDARGTWVVRAPGQPIDGQLNLTGNRERPTGTLSARGQEVRLAAVTVRPESRRVRMTMQGAALGMDGTIRLSGTLSGNRLDGWGELPDGSLINWSAERTQTVGDDGGNSSGNGNTSASRAVATLDLPDIYPPIDYGVESVPEQPQHVLVRNATVWTMGPQGIMENADLLVERGKVVRVGQNLDAPSGARIVDATGKHVTPGMIDAHLHSGSGGGINEGGNAIVPEVRIGDVLTANNAWMYRQLAGGLTTAHLMHGSANPIGGQNQHMKMRWGRLAAEQKLEGAPRTVKFALGENVTRNTSRYPNTRQGVEQIIRDHFQAAREYEARWAEWESNQRGIPPRRDLRLEALVDILNGDILVQSHSYRQDEILTLIRLAEEFDLQIKAFHHGVEAYRVAPELRDHGAGAVVWSDWSSFKVESYNASLFNARLLHEAGVVTSLHSDNSEIAARMNWEAAKMVRAGMDEEDALALVTINTAILLGIDDMVGSLEQGKDADFVIWSGNPLSQFTTAEQTWIDGTPYFTIERHRELERKVADERARLIQYVLNGS